MANKRDDKAPKTLIVRIEDADGNLWGVVTAKEKEFSSGSVGFYANGKVENPEDEDARYQVGGNIVLIGSKPAK